MMSLYQERNYKLISGYCRLQLTNMNIIDGIILIIFEYHRLAKWSNKYKGNNIELLEDGTKAMSTDDGHSVRADFCVNRGQLISWELEFEIKWGRSNFLGVVSSEVTDFCDCPNFHMKNAWGLDDENYIYRGTHAESVKWAKPSFPTDGIFVLKITADWREKQCKLTFFFNGKEFNEDNDQCTMLLPKLDDEYVWYPCVAPYNVGAYIIIRYV